MNNIESAHLLQKTLLAAPLFCICAYKTYRSFRCSDSKVKLGKFILGLALLVITLVALYSVTIAGLNGYAFLAFALTVHLLAPGLILGLFVGSAVGISVRAWGSGEQSHKTIITACWLFILLAGVISVTLRQQRETYQQKNRIKSELALDFAKHHRAVIEKVGANAAPRLTSMIFPKGATPNNGRLLPIGYVISIGTHLYAIVSTSQAAEDHTFTLDCITSLSDEERYRKENLCK